MRNNLDIADGTLIQLYDGVSEDKFLHKMKRLAIL